MQSLRLRAIIYPADGLWVAHALEMDLIGTGATEAAALRELRSNVEAQLSFAKQEKINPFHPAPAEIQKLRIARGCVQEAAVKPPCREPQQPSRQQHELQVVLPVRACFANISG